MAKIIVSFLVIVSVLFVANVVGSDSHQNPRKRAFIDTQCQNTRYPRLCKESLSNCVNSSAQSRQQIAQASLLVALVKAKHTKAYVTQVAKEMKQSKGKDYQAVCDCLDQINDSVDQLTQSIKELQTINQGGEDSFMWHSSNVQAWVSTALTDASTCLDGFPGHAMGGKVKATIKTRVLNVAQVCSIALALFNRFVARHRAGTKSKP